MIMYCSTIKQHFKRVALRHCHKQLTDIVDLILKHHAENKKDKDFVNNSGQDDDEEGNNKVSPLMAALLANGADVHSTDKENQLWSIIMLFLQLFYIRQLVGLVYRCLLDFFVLSSSASLSPFRLLLVCLHLLLSQY